MTGYSNIRLSKDARGVARLVLARPEAHNALNPTTIAELTDAAVRLAIDGSVRVVVLSAEGQTFCAGADLKWMNEQAKKDRAGMMAEATKLAEMLRALDALPKPLIGCIERSVYGGGIGLMVVCDVTLVSTRSRFALPEVRLGLIPATIGPYFVRRLGEGAARRIFFNPHPFSAEDAVQLGLASRAVAPEAFEAAVEQEIAGFLEGAPGAIADAKRFCIDLARNPGVDYLAIGASRLADRWETLEAQQGIAKFLARSRPPV